MDDLGTRANISVSRRFPWI